MKEATFNLRHQSSGDPRGQPIIKDPEARHKASGLEIKITNQKGPRRTALQDRGTGTSGPLRHIQADPALKDSFLVMTVTIIILL